MRYLLNILFPLVLQLLFTWIIIEATKGGGSFVGLAAMLVAVLAIPATAIWNFNRVRRNPGTHGAVLFAGSLLTSFVFPVLVLLTFIVQAVVGAVFGWR